MIIVIRVLSRPRVQRERHAMTISFGPARRCAMYIIPTTWNVRRESQIYLCVSRKRYPRVSVCSLNHFGDDAIATICLSKFSNKFISTNLAVDQFYDLEIPETAKWFRHGTLRNIEHIWKTLKVWCTLIVLSKWTLCI